MKISPCYDPSSVPVGVALRRRGVSLENGAIQDRLSSVSYVKAWLTDAGLVVPFSFPLVSATVARRDRGSQPRQINPAPQSQNLTAIPRQIDPSARPSSSTLKL